MAKKTIIKRIHKEDAFYPYRKLLVGMMAKAENVQPNKLHRGYIAGDVLLSKEVPVIDEDWTIERCVYFYAVKLEEVDA